MSKHLTPGYVTELQHDLHLLELTFAAGVIAALGVFLVHGINAGIWRRVAGSNVLLTLAAAATTALAVYAYKFRPDTGAPPSLLSASVKPAVAHKEFNQFFQSASFRWFAWYLGTFALVFVVIGFIVLGVRAARTDSPAFILLATAVPVTLLYIARPSVSPDHLWAMRRYLPIVLPVMTIAAAAAAIWATKTIGRWQPRLRAPFVVLVVAAMLIPAARAGRPFVRAQMQGGALAAVHDLCQTVGANGAVGIEPFGTLGMELPQTVRGFCGVPSAALRTSPKVPLTTIALEWKTIGRQFYVATVAPRPVLAAAPHATEVADVVVSDAREPERTVGRRPSSYNPLPVEVWLYRVDPD